MNKAISEKEGFAALLLRLRSHGIDDRRLLSAFESVPRDVFLSPELREHAYEPRILPIDCGGFCENIDNVVRLIHHLDVHSAHKVLEVGCGSGYTAAVLSRLSERVTTVDRYQSHITNAMHRFEHIGASNVVAKHMDGSEGVGEEGLFDRVFISASFKEMPRHYADHITSAGIMIAPLSLGNGKAKMMRLTKVGSRFEREDLFEVIDSPFIPGLAAAL